MNNALIYVVMFIVLQLGFVAGCYVGYNKVYNDFVSMLKLLIDQIRSEQNV